MSALDNARVSKASGLVRAAARNNAEWCHAFSGTYGIDGLFHAGFWSSPVRTPPLYPDAVTLLPDVSVEHLLSSVDTTGGCSVKDSFACLDLGAAGFEALFWAEWVGRRPAHGQLAARPGWSAVTTVPQLRAWEECWGVLPSGPGFFRPALLQIESVAVLGRWDGGRVVAGAIANRSAAVIGLSNVFDAAGDLVSAWAEAAHVASTLWGDMPTVGYDAGDSLDAPLKAGFERIGELVVWHRPAPSTTNEARSTAP